MQRSRCRHGVGVVNIAARNPHHDVSDNYTRHTVTRSSLVCLITRLSVVRGSWLSAPDWPSGEVPVTSRVGGAERPPAPPTCPSPTPSLLVLSQLRTPEPHLAALLSHRNQAFRNWLLKLHRTPIEIRLLDISSRSWITSKRRYAAIPRPNSCFRHR
ncbi:unnamed protein product [Nezara viridula]|uniref:Uncharacterized protein n=1 Tax=Nezara viridula TaxID=85310 RepID=A0A9P0HLK9_NEZVI|nr:unnamed protein product [Nezara viridula]